MRSSGEGTAESLNRLVHIRGRKDLHPVRFQVMEDSKQSHHHGGGKPKYVAVCPITGSAIGSGSIQSFLVVRSSYWPESSLRNRKKSDNIRGVEPRGNESKRPIKPDVQQSAADEARNTVRSAVESNPVLSNLFGKNKSSVTEKERRDALFTRDC